MEKDFKKKPDYVIDYFSSTAMGKEYREEAVRRSKEKAIKYKECESCENARIKCDGFCYMFEDRPEKLPCGQHTKFKSLRQATAKRIKKNPLVLLDMINKVNYNAG